MEMIRTLISARYNKESGKKVIYVFCFLLAYLLLISLLFLVYHAPRFLSALTESIGLYGYGTILCKNILEDTIYF